MCFNCIYNAFLRYIANVSPSLHFKINDFQLELPVNCKLATSPISPEALIYPSSYEYMPKLVSNSVSFRPPHSIQLSVFVNVPP